MLIESVAVARRWKRYMKLFRLSSHYKQPWMMYTMAVLYIAASPSMKLWEILGPLFSPQRLRVQIEIFRHDGRNAKVAAEIEKVSDGSAIAFDLAEGDPTISHIYYQVVRIHDEAVLDIAVEAPSECV
jgi:hypothetical protein